MVYFLADGIYPKLTIIVQAFSQTLDIPEYVRFNKYQMDKRKDVKHSFRVLQDWSRVFPVPIPEPTNNGRVFMSTLKNLEMHLQLRTDLVKHIAARPGRGGQAADLSSLEGTNMEYVVLPSSYGDYDDTDLKEEVVHGQNEDGAFDYYGDYNDQIPDDFEHAFEHVYRDRHVEDEYEHDGDDDEDDEDDEEEEDDEDDDDVEDDDEEAAYNGEDFYDDVESEDVL
ncbi:acidic leucine-rich nuclear phosphoprotein 32 family member B-like [Papaver somniferum]|uniref:acidic leucine-rich nuclear phosphoprotein 32 family member B-like n=1 Tax=Papaver somniferum TaxID=3469 RepID=UPI000E6FC354|nr:acidic leucine-rich nuclear phosphoprotein 32 family member B-like [Papaver somniferum]